MKAYIHKIIALLLVAVLVAGCGSNLDNSEITDNNASTDVSDSVGENDVSVPADTSSEADVSTDNSETSNEVSNDVSSDVSNDVSNDVSDDTTVPVEHTHNYIVTDSKDATCTEKGYVVKKCTCGAENKKEVAALGHEAGKWIVITEATTEIKGIKRKYCTRCDEMLEEVTTPRLEEDISFDPNVSEPDVHAFRIVTVAPTCTTGGYSIYECKDCDVTGERFDEIDPLGHKHASSVEWETVLEATTEAEGRRVKKCNRVNNGVTCNHIIAEETIPKLGKYAVIATAENTDLVEERILYYINEYRTSEGACEMSMLTNKARLFARKRAEQLVTNYAHDEMDARAAAAEYEYGDYIPPYPESYYDFEKDEVVYTGNMCPGYYSPYGGEAIGYAVYVEVSVDALAEHIAEMVYESKAHWDYVGNGANGYLAIGVYKHGTRFYFCFITSDTEYYDNN